MQILRWLFKETNEKATGKSPGPTKPKQTDCDQNIVVYKHSGVHRKSKSVEGSKQGSKKLKKIFLLCGTDVAKACFYSTVNLKRPSNVNRQQDWINSMKVKKEDIARGLGVSNNKIDTASTHAGNKVLPISEATLSASANANIKECSTSGKKEKLKGDKGKTMSRMKELFRWAATAKSEKGAKFMGRKVLQLRNRGTLKSVPDDDQLSIESPKISFRWEVESCSTTSSAYSAISLASSSAVTMPSLYSTSIQHHGDHCPPRKGNWITTDSEFVVLEL